MTSKILMIFGLFLLSVTLPKVHGFPQPFDDEDDDGKVSGIGLNSCPGIGCPTEQPDSTTTVVVQTTTPTTDEIEPATPTDSEKNESIITQPSVLPREKQIEEKLDVIMILVSIILILVI